MLCKLIECAQKMRKRPVNAMNAMFRCIPFRSAWALSHLMCIHVSHPLQTSLTSFLQRLRYCYLKFECAECFERFEWISLKTRRKHRKHLKHTRTSTKQPKHKNYLNSSDTRQNF